MTEHHLVLWWVPEGHRPTLYEARERLVHLRVKGPSPFAFTPSSHFPMHDEIGDRRSHNV